VAKPAEPTGLALVDGLAALVHPTVEEYCAASAEYIREATALGAQKGKAAQPRLSRALAVVTLADVRAATGLAMPLAFAGPVVVFDRLTGEIHSRLPPVGTGLRWPDFVAGMADSYEARFAEI
jgi:hypothetical protein